MRKIKWREIEVLLQKIMFRLKNGEDPYKIQLDLLNVLHLPGDNMLPNNFDLMDLYEYQIKSYNTLIDEAIGVEKYEVCSKVQKIMLNDYKVYEEQIGDNEELMERFHLINNKYERRAEN